MAICREEIIRRRRTNQKRRVLLEAAGAGAPQFEYPSADVGLTEGDGFTTGSSLTMPANGISAGDQILIFFSYNQAATYTYADQPSDNVDGTTGWKLMGYWGDATSDHWMSIWEKTASGGETTITYATHATVDVAALTMRRDAADAVDFVAVQTAGGQNGLTYTIPPYDLPAPQDGSSMWRVTMIDDDGDTFSYADSTDWTELATINDGGVTPTQALSIYIQDEDTAGTAVSGSQFTTAGSSGKRQELLAFVADGTWPVPVIESHTESTGSVSSASAHTVTLPSNLAVGDLLVFYWVVSDDGASFNPVIGGVNPEDPTAPFQRFAYYNDSTWVDDSNAGTDVSLWVQYRIVDGNESSTYDVRTGNINSRTCDAVILHISGVSPGHVHGDKPYVFSTNNLTTQSIAVPLRASAPNSLNLFAMGMNAGTFTWTTPPTGSSEYALTTNNLVLYTHERTNQDPQQYGTTSWTNATSSPVFSYSIINGRNDGG